MNNLYNALVHKKYSRPIKCISRYTDWISSIEPEERWWLSGETYKTKFWTLVINLWKWSIPSIDIRHHSWIVWWTLIKSIWYSEVFESEEWAQLLIKRINDIITERESEQIDKNLSVIRAHIRDIVWSYEKIFDVLLRLDMNTDDDTSIMIRTEAASMLSTAINHTLTWQWNVSSPFKNFISRLSWKKN